MGILIGVFLIEAIRENSSRNCDAIGTILVVCVTQVLIDNRCIRLLRMLLEAAGKEPSVKRFVLTSSDQAASNRSTTREIQIIMDMWNEEAIKAAWKPPL